jgi:Fic family protein
MMLKERYTQIDELTATLRARVQQLRPTDRENFSRWVLFTWLHHEFAIEGTVTRLDEVREALSGAQPTDSSLVSIYRDLKAHEAAIQLVREEAHRKVLRLRMAFIRKLYDTLSGETGDPRKTPYRRDIPIHRLYFHEVCPPEKIAQRMSRFLAWVDSAEFRKCHPITAALLLHSRFMEIFPFSQHSGKIGRLLANLVLLHSGYEPVVIHSSDRHRYYEALRAEIEELSVIIEDSMENTLRSWLKLVTHGHRPA